jgi:hypothetical protein
MPQILAHVTPNEVPAFWMAALAGFIAGVTVTLAMLARKTK